MNNDTPPVVTVLAAASTVDAVTEAADRFQHDTGTVVRVSAGPSNGLARQILSGAPADVFLSASTDWADAIAKADLAAEHRPLLSNGMVLVVPKGNPAGVNSPDDLTNNAVTRVAVAGEGVPAGIYADEILRQLDLSDELARSGTIVRGHDVRLTLGYVERAEVDAGIVYATDAAVAEQVEVVHRFDGALHRPIVYPAVLVRDGPAGEARRAFYEFLASPAACDIFRRHGFLTLADVTVASGETAP